MQNILKEGLTIMGEGRSHYTDGGFNKASEKKRKVLKSEAPLSLAKEQFTK